MGDIASKLDSLRPIIIKEVTALLVSTARSASYTIVWRDFEDLVLTAFSTVVRRHITVLEEQSFDRGEAGTEKNRLADLEIRQGHERIAVAVKAARKSKDPANDLGTFHNYPKRKKVFTDSFDLWVRYDDSDPKGIRVDRIFFDRSFRCVGKSTVVNGVSYRKKDGNMRPKPWVMFDLDRSYWATEREFDAAVKIAEEYRANSLVEEHLGSMTEADQRRLYGLLKRKFES